MSATTWMGAGFADPTLGEVGAGAADEPALASLLLGGRPAGHFLGAERLA